MGEFIIAKAMAFENMYLKKDACVSHRKLPHAQETLFFFPIETYFWRLGFLGRLDLVSKTIDFHIFEITCYRK